MSEVRVKVGAFAGDEDDRVVGLDEIGGKRRGVLCLPDDTWAILGSFFYHPGEPFLGPEFAAQVFARANVVIESINLRIADLTKGYVACTITFRRGDDVWTMPALTHDALGFSIATGVPVTLSETDFALIVENSPEIEEGDAKEEAASVEHAEFLATKLPKDKLGQA